MLFNYLKFVLGRLINSFLLGENNQVMLVLVDGQVPRASQVAQKVVPYLNRKFKTPLPDEEVMLMAPQIQRII